MIYLASPYSHSDPAVRDARFALTRDYVAKCLSAGEVIFSPIVYTHEMACRYSLPGDAKWWERFNNHMILSSRGIRILQIDGWGVSKGVRQEIELAKSLYLPMEFIPWPE